MVSEVSTHHNNTWKHKRTHKHTSAQKKPTHTSAFFCFYAPNTNQLLQMTNAMMTNEQSSCHKIKSYSQSLSRCSLNSRA